MPVLTRAGFVVQCGEYANLKNAYQVTADTVKAQPTPLSVICN